MKRLVIVNTLTLLICGLSAAVFGSQQSLEGDWVGTLRVQDRQDRVDIHFQIEGGHLKGTVDVPLKEQMGIALSNITLDSSRVRFEWQERSGAIIFRGQLADGTISGEVLQGEAQGTLQLARIAKIDPQVYDQYCGLYEVGPDKLISITRFPPGPVYVDYESGRTGALFPLLNDTFFGGPAFLMPAPIDVTIRFARDERGQVAGLSYQEKGQPEKRARRIKFRQEEVTFRNGPVTLSGTLTLPNTAGPYPAVVRIAGAGPITRLNTAEFHSAYHGVAFLSYDKRGTGKSTGDWRQAGLDDLAGDALAALRLLKSRPDIDHKLIGIGGGSEGGWVAPIVASRDKDVAFMSLYGGPAFNFLDEVLYEVEADLLSRGFSADDVKAALDFERTVFGWIKTGEVLTDAGWEKVQAAAAKVQNEKWFAAVKPWPKGHWLWKKYFLMSQTDTQPLLEKTTIPVLAIYGGTDLNVPALRNIPALNAEMKKAGNTDCTIVLFPRANHEFMEAVTGDLEEESPGLQRYVPGLFDATTDWLRKRVGTKR